MNHPINAIGILKKQKSWGFGINQNGKPICGYSYTYYNKDKNDGKCTTHYIYRDQIKFCHIKRGQSSTRAVFTTRDGSTLEMAPMEMGFFFQVLTGVTNIPFSIDSEGYVDVHFLLYKQGSNIGIEVVNPETVEFKDL